MQKSLSARGVVFTAFDFPEVDITQKSMLERLINEIKPQTLVNCAAYTNVNKAESDYGNAYNINALGPRYLADICDAEGIEMVHISTDYVFSGIPVIENGKPRAYIETDECAPVTVYGKTKYDGECYVKEGCRRFYILRTAWLYGEGNNFIQTMLRLSETKDSLQVVGDQIGSPTSTVDLAEAICTLIGTGDYGLYHATCEGQCSWYDFAKKIFELKGTNIRLAAVTSEQYGKDYPGSAPRPKWSVLENAALKRLGKNVFRHWEDSLKEYLKCQY